MKILLVTSPIVSLRQPFAGGTEAFVVALANGLGQRGHEVDVLCKNADEDNAFNTLMLQESAFRMEDGVTSESDGQKLYQAAQFGLFDSSSYDIIHYHSYYHCMYEFSFLHQRRNVITLHSPYTERLGLTHRLNSRRGDDIYVAVSQRLQQEWQPYLHHPVQVISNGIELSDFCLNAPRQARLIWAGRLCPDKAPHLAIRIAELVNMPLVLCGQITDEDYFAQHVAPCLNSDIQYKGALTQSQLRAEIAASTALLMTSIWQEPFGLATVEALASDIPVIGLATAIPPELRFPPCTQIVDLDHPETITAAIHAVARIPVGKCRAQVAHLSLNNTISAYEAIYAQVS